MARIHTAESEIKSAASVTYTYDGDGNRLEKSSGEIYWYGAGTEILDESGLSGNFTSEYVFFGGKRVARRDVGSGNIFYYAEDMLGSSRTIVQAGQTSPCYDADFYPFGGERDVVNTCTQNYKFEGKERDTETLNDDFGARYYSWRLGRWLSADWSSVPAPVPYANLTNPQTLNLYAMVSDNPETFADLDGHVPTILPAPVSASLASATGVDPCLNPNAALDPTEQQQQNSAAEQSERQQTAQPPPAQTLSEKGLEFIEQHEGYSDKVYKDAAGFDTIGYGHKVLPGEDFSKGITKQEAAALLKSDVEDAVKDVNAALKVSVTQNQFDALVSLRYNAGTVSVLPANQMMTAVNAGKVAESNFTAYRYVHSKDGKPVVNQGLLNRRQDEWKMFSGGGQSGGGQ